MGNEVLEFATAIGAKDLKTVFENTKFSGLFMQHNYFLFNRNNYLIIKISRTKKQPFFGVGKSFLDFFNEITEQRGNYLFIGLQSNKSGWILSKQDLSAQISVGILSYSEAQAQYKINIYNLKDDNHFASVEEFISKVGRMANNSAS